MVICFPKFPKNYPKKEKIFSHGEQSVIGRDDGKIYIPKLSDSFTFHKGGEEAEKPLRAMIFDRLNESSGLFNHHPRLIINFKIHGHLKPLRATCPSPSWWLAGYFNFSSTFFASSAPENFVSSSRAFFNSLFASSLSPFLK